MSESIADSSTNLSQQTSLVLDHSANIASIKEKGSRSFRFLMTLALKKAQIAVELDNNSKGPDTILAYKAAIDTLTLNLSKVSLSCSSDSLLLQTDLLIDGPDLSKFSDNHSEFRLNSNSTEIINSSSLESNHSSDQSGVLVKISNQSLEISKNLTNSRLVHNKIENDKTDLSEYCFSDLNSAEEIPTTNQSFLEDSSFYQKFDLNPISSEIKPNDSNNKNYSAKASSVSDFHINQNPFQNSALDPINSKYSNILDLQHIPPSIMNKPLKMDLPVSTSPIVSPGTNVSDASFISSHIELNNIISSTVSKENIFSDSTSSNNKINDIFASKLSHIDTTNSIFSEKNVANRYDLFSPDKNKFLTEIGSEFLALESNLSLNFSSISDINTSKVLENGNAYLKGNEAQMTPFLNSSLLSYDIKSISSLNYRDYFQNLFPAKPKKTFVSDYNTENSVLSIFELNKQYDLNNNFNPVLMKLCYSQYNNPLRPMWVIRLLLQSMSKDGGFVTPALFLSQQIWHQNHVHFSAMEQKLLAINKLTPRLNFLKNINLPNIIFLLPENKNVFDAILEHTSSQSANKELSDQTEIENRDSIFDLEDLRDAEINSLGVACSKMGLWLDGFDIIKDSVRRNLCKKLKFIFPHQDLASQAFCNNRDLNASDLKNDKLGNTTALAIFDLVNMSNNAFNPSNNTEKKFQSVHNKLSIASDSTKNGISKTNYTKTTNDIYPWNLSSMPSDTFLESEHQNHQSHLANKPSKVDYKKDLYSSNKLKATPSRFPNFGKIRKSVDKFYLSLNKDKIAESIAYIELIKHLLDLVLNLEQFILYFSQLALIPELDKLIYVFNLETPNRLSNGDFNESQKINEKKYRKNSTARFQMLTPTLKSSRKVPNYYKTSESLQPNIQTNETILSSSSSFQLPTRSFNNGTPTAQNLSQNYGTDNGIPTTLNIGSPKHSKLVGSIIRAALLNKENNNLDYRLIVQEACYKVCKAYGENHTLNRIPSVIFFRLLDISEWFNSVLLPWIFHDMHTLLLHHTKKVRDWVIA
ncbi:hypothetical protein BB561_004911 [Smittium simulii]|uniref:MIT domain-containing protein n=1 Tax=Smittium simulii TaxID=133385 RepID=A0A2T9YDD6_9FUNG|nr:hypothetical protein BB561_004911 [Smittium simulii]